MKKPTWDAKNLDFMTTTKEWDAAITEAHARGVREGLERAMGSCQKMGHGAWATDATSRIRALIAALPKEGT